MEVRVDQPQMPPGESWLRHLDHAVGQARVFVAVLPADAQGSHLAQWADAARAVQRRGTDVVPVLLPPAGIRDLAGWPAIEYAGPDAGVRLADRVQLCAAIDLADFSESRLEALVSDLLQRQGWSIASRARLPDAGYDIRAIRSTRPDNGWPAESLIEIRAYRHGRVSVREIHRLAAVVRQHEGTAGLLVTNGQLTSVARRAAEEANQAGVPLEVTDGPALRQMLLENPDIAWRYAPPADPEVRR
jgi:Restriction endonuclease